MLYNLDYKKYFKENAIMFYEKIYGYYISTFSFYINLIIFIFCDYFYKMNN